MPLGQDRWDCGRRLTLICRLPGSEYVALQKLMLHPVRKWIATGLAKGTDEVTDVPAPFIHGFDEPLQAVGIMVVPFRWNPLSTAPKVTEVRLFRSCEYWLKRFPSCNSLVDASARVNPVDGEVGEIPLGCVEAVSLVDQKCAKLAAGSRTRENGLPRIGVSRPLVKDDAAAQVIEVFDLLEEAIRQIVVDFQMPVHGIARVSRCELQPAAARYL